MPKNPFQELDQQAINLSPAKPESIFSFLQQLKEMISTLEETASREQIISWIPQIRNIAAQSPFVNRAQHWPKGYQGDFETIGHIISGENKAVPGSIGYLIEDFFLSSEICQQHINKVARQAELIGNVLKANPAARIMSIGCGTSEDIRLNIPAIASTDTHFTIVDADSDAIQYSMQNLASIQKQVTAIRGNIYKIVRTLKESYDLILIGGVFDYLNDKTIVSVLSSLKQNLNQNAILFFTNIQKPNPHRIFMEYLSDWILIERTEEDIQHLLDQSRLSDFNIKIENDQTGLTYLVECHRPN